MSRRPIVLFVDDESAVLEGMVLTQGRHFDVRVAQSAAEGLELLRKEPSIEVVIADMQMPEMDGATFLAQVRDSPSDAVRMLLTGHADFHSAIRAVNEGRIFRYLSKPCSPEEMTTALRAALEQYRLTTSARKLESIGELAAGIAHEINTPSQYVKANTVFLAEVFSQVHELLSGLRVLTGVGGSVATAAIDKLLEDADAEFIQSEIPQALEQSLDGMNRITEIVRSMKDHSHQSIDKAPADLNRAIKSTFTVASHEWKTVANVVFDLDDTLPEVPCFLGYFNQAILSIIVNAAHAVGDTIGESGGKGTISASTRLAGHQVEICISDTGPGMSESTKNQIFTKFFTTKGVGKGTGQGLSIAQSVIVDRHGGTIDVNSELGKGTSFVIRLPLASEIETRTAVGR